MAGQIIKRGDSWQVRIFIGNDAKGKRKYHNKTVRGTKKDAQKYLTAKLREKDLGVLIEPASMLLNEYLDKWLNEIAKQKLRNSTFSSYESVLRNYVRAVIGQKNFPTFKPTKCRNFITI
jgi:integrase